MTLEDLLTLTRRRIGTIVLCTVLGGLAAFGVLWMTPVSYTAASTAYVRVTVPTDDGTASSANAYYNASQLATQKVKAFVPVFTSETVAQKVIEKLGLSETPSQLASQVTASNATNALTINVTATSSSPDQARTIADAVVEQAAAQVKVLEGENSPVGIVLMAPSSLSSITQSPSTTKYMGAGILAGLLLGYVVAFARAQFDTRLRTADDVANRVDVPILGIIPESATIARTTIDTAGGDFRAEESLRKLRTNLRYANVDTEMRVVVVTSPLQGDGKSSIAANLAKVMAMAGQDVVLIDADLRRPTVRDLFGVHADVGLTHVLVGNVGLEQAVVATSIAGLSVLPAGETPPNPSELLGSRRMTELVEYLGRDRMVIIDAPPVLPVTDAAVLAKAADGVLVVVQSGRTTSDQLEQALSSLDQAGGTIAGIVLNRAASSRLARMRYGDSEYGYGYSESDYGYRGREGHEGRSEGAAGERVVRSGRSGRSGRPGRPARSGRAGVPGAGELPVGRADHAGRAAHADVPDGVGGPVDGPQPGRPAHADDQGQTDIEEFFQEIGVTSSRIGDDGASPEGTIPPPPTPAADQRGGMRFPPVRGRR